MPYTFKIPVGSTIFVPAAPPQDGRDEDAITVLKNLVKGKGKLVPPKGQNSETWDFHPRNAEADFNFKLIASDFIMKFKYP